MRRGRQEFPTNNYHFAKFSPTTPSQCTLPTPPREKSKNFHFTDKETDAREVKEVCLPPEPLLLTPAPSCPYTLISHG